jgi:hypothetical protein
MELLSGSPGNQPRSSSSAFNVLNPAVNEMNTEETNRLTSQAEILRRIVCTGISFGGMRNCNERYNPEESQGYHELTWGIMLNFAKHEPLVLTWKEDPCFGDPFFLDFTEARKFLTIDSLELQDVSAFSPWNTYVGSRLLDFCVLKYEANYPSGGKTVWRTIQWGLELLFEGGPLLVGAMRHGNFLEYTICADEIVVVYDLELINKAKALRDGQKSEWTEPFV